MPYVEGYAKVRVWVPAGRPEYPDQGLPPGSPGYPDQGLPGDPEYPDQGLPPGFPGRPGQGLPRPPRPVDPDWGVDEGAGPGQGLPGFPEYPGQGLPRPPRPERGPYPIVPTDDIGGHPELPDLNMPGRWATVSKGRSGHSGWPAWIVDPHREPPQVEEDYEHRHPTSGVPGEWVTVLYQGAIAWAWVPDIEDTSGPEHPGEPEVPEEPGEDLRLR